MRMDIRDTDFVTKFDREQVAVGVIGHGYVGSAVDSFFRWKVDGNGDPVKLFDVYVYDRAKPELDSLTTVVKESSVIFVCVPTPMNLDGSCHTGIVESVLKDIVTEAGRQARSLDSFVVVIKSTVYPGFTSEMQERYGLRLVFSPEFLTEKNSVDDMERCNRVLLGGDIDDGRVVFKFFETKLLSRLQNGSCVIVSCKSDEAEMAKLFTNGILMTKVLFCNEIYQLCQKAGIDYDEVRGLACLDPRIGQSHTMVPGHDGSLGAGGSCFPKDINNLRIIAAQIGSGERIFSAVIARNNELRPQRDWEQLKGRAVVDGG